MNATPQLARIAEALRFSKLEAVMIGNAAAVLQGAPVTTMDFDFMFRSTPVNIAKLKKFAARLNAQVFRPYYPASRMFRVVNDDDGLQVDFVSHAHGIKSFASLRSRAVPVEFAGCPLQVASLDDIIASKRAAGRARDMAALPAIETARHEKQNNQA